MSRLDTLEEKFKAKVEAVLAETEKETEMKWICTDGRRTIAEQNAHFRKGRDEAGNIVNKKLIVTRAKGGESPHNFGLAADCYPIKDGEIWWDAPAKIMNIYANIAKEFGLSAGFYFTTIYDAPHIEQPGWKNVRNLWRQGKIKVA